MAIYISENTGISKLNLYISYNTQVLQRINTTPTGILPMLLPPPAARSPYALGFAADELSAATSDTGILATMRFKVLDMAVAGTTPITISVASAYAATEDTHNPISISVVGGSVTVTVPPLPSRTVSFQPGAYAGFPPGETGQRYIACGTRVSAPQAPTRPGYIFAGWLLDDAPVSFPIYVTGDIALMAAWAAVATPTPAWRETTAEPESVHEPEPTPNPTSSLFNQQPSYMRSGFTFLGALILIGMAALGINGISKKKRE